MKRIAFFTSLALVLCLTSAFSPAFASSNFGGGDGTEASPYLISTAQHLRTLAEDVNSGISYEGVYFQMTNDIDLEGNAENQWEPIGRFVGTHIGATFEPFAGIFDGMGYVVSGLYIDTASTHMSLGLFGANVGTIQNLGVSGIVKGRNTIVASVVAENWSIVRNCYNAGTTLYSNLLIGGVVGRTEMGKNSWNLAPNSDSLVEGCYNEVPLKITQDSELDLIMIDGIGGVVGSGIGIVKNCYNTADIFVSGLGSLVGGIVGETGGDDTDRSLVENCYNTGSITITYPVDDMVHVASDIGGVVGMSNHTDYRDCYNSGSVIGETAIGGLVGLSVSDTFENCYNIAPVSGKYIEVGGLVGGGHESTLTSCYNTGSVTVDNDRAGGLMGDDSNSILQNCYNNGSVSGNEDVGGLIGFGINSTLENCCNMGTVSGNKEFGSLIGRKSDGPLIKNCYYNNESCPLETVDGSGMPTISFERGEITYLLQNNQKDQIWGQSLPGDDCPILTDDPAKRVYQVTFVSESTPIHTVYTNGAVEKPADPVSETSGKEFLFWSAGEEGSAPEFDFQEPVSADTTLYAHWKTVSTPTPTPSGGGSVGKKPSTTPPPAEATPEETPPVETPPEETPPVETPPAETPVPVTERFADVRADAWYRDAIQYVSDKGMMVGLEPNAFSPETTSTRGTIVTMLYRLEGEPAVANSRFSDVPGDAWYAKGAAWAAANGIVNGFEDASFRPESPVTREQLAAILYRYAAEKGYDVTDRAELSGFSDAGNISTYAVDAMGWAKAAGIINGTDWGGLDPAGTATRAEIAAMLMRFCENVMN